MIHTARDDTKRVDVEPRISLVKHGELWLEHRHLQDLVALLLAAGEAHVHRAAEHLGIHVDELDPLEFDDLVREKMKLLEMSPEFLDRSVNEGFSGGEKKRNEILQMALLEPALCILDETDSGLDIDALRVVADGVNAMLNPNLGILLITHYQRLLNHIVPDYVHVMDQGRIVKTGGKELALELEERGYEGIEAEVAGAAPGVAEATS